MWASRQHKVSREKRAIRIVLALVLVLSLTLLFLHVHTDDGLIPCPQCVLLAGLVLPLVALLMQMPQGPPAPVSVWAGDAPQPLRLWSRRQLRGPPSTR